MRAMQIAQDGMSFAAGLVTIMLGLHGRRSMTGPSTAEVEESSRQAGDQKETKGMKMEGAEELSPKARSDPYRDMIAKGEIVAGRWNLVKKLGEGGFGVVWEAQSVEKRGRKRAGKAAWNCGGKVAIKIESTPMRKLRGGKQVMLADESIKGEPGMLKHEFKALEMLKGAKGVPHPVEFIDAGEHFSGSHGFTHSFLVMPLLANDLNKVKIKKHTERGFVADMGRSILDTLRFCHTRGIMHCDVSPGNIMMDSSANFVLVDWGLSEQYKDQDGALLPSKRKTDPTKLEDRDHRGFGAGTPDYLSYRVFKGKGHTPRDDLESLCLVMMDKACGGLPWIMTGHCAKSTDEEEVWHQARERYKTAKDLCSGMHKGFQPILACVHGMDLFECDYDALERLLYMLDSDCTTVEWFTKNDGKRKAANKKQADESDKENHQPALGRNKRLRLKNR